MVLHLQIMISPLGMMFTRLEIAIKFKLFTNRGKLFLPQVRVCD